MCGEGGRDGEGGGKWKGEEMENRERSRGEKREMTIFALPSQ